MIFNNSILRFNVTFKGREYGFAPYETKRFRGRLTDKEEQTLASKYNFLIYKPETKKEILKEEEKLEKTENSNTAKLETAIAEKIEIQGKPDIPPVDPEPIIEPFEDLYNTRESILIAEKETIVIKEEDVVDVVEEVENIPLDVPVKKVHYRDDDFDTDDSTNITEDESEVVEESKTKKKTTTKKTTKKKK